MATLVLLFKKIENVDKTKSDTFFSHSKTETTINESDIDDAFESIYSIIILNIQKSLGKCSGRIIDLIIEHNIRISKYNPPAGSSYIKLPKELDHSREELINIENIDDNECFRWSLVRYLNPGYHNQATITKADKKFMKKFDFKCIKFPVKIETFEKLEKVIPSALVFLVIKIRKSIQFMYQKNAVKKNMLICY